MINKFTKEDFTVTCDKCGEQPTWREGDKDFCQGHKTYPTRWELSGRRGFEREGKFFSEFVRQPKLRKFEFKEIEVLPPKE